MKKILFITTRSPFSGKYSGDIIRSLKIINLLKKKYEVHIVCLDNDKQDNLKKNIISFNYPGLLLKFIFCLYSFFKLQPIQFGLFYSEKMRAFIENTANDYDYLFFYHIRSSQYFPKNFFGKTILEMNDLYSDNYLQTFNYLNIINPLKYIYFLESILMKRTENKVFSVFDRITLLSKKEVNKINKNFKGKIFSIDELVYKVSKKFSFSKKNQRILFIGNLNYLPNLLACKDFIKNILPKLIKSFPEIKFSIIGSVSNFNKFLLSKNPNVEVLGSKKVLTKYIKDSFCGLANLKIATGLQGKVLTYMSFGLPVICSKKVAENFGKNVIYYNKNSELIEKILQIKNSKITSNKFSKKSISLSKSLNLKKMGFNYYKLLKF